MKKPVSSKVIDQTMSYILDHPYMSDDELNILASDPDSRKALSALKSLMYMVI